MNILDLPLDSYTLITLPAKKWHWRARCGALILSNLIPKVDPEDVLFCSSVLNLTELLGLRPDLHPLKKVVYFHENQLIYPVQEIKERDVQYSYNQIITRLMINKLLSQVYKGISVLVCLQMLYFLIQNLTKVLFSVILGKF